MRTKDYGRKRVRWMTSQRERRRNGEGRNGEAERGKKRTEEKRNEMRRLRAILETSANFTIIIYIFVQQLAR